MSLIPCILFCALFALSTAAGAVNPIQEHPHSVVVTEGRWANFSCGVKGPGFITWKIGDFVHDGNDYNTADKLPQVEGVTAERSFVDITGKIKTETIGILATEELDGTPVECLYNDSGNNFKLNSYSKFALLNVQISSGIGE